MTVRRFLLCYLGAIAFIGVAGATGYQALLRQHTETTAARPVMVADASPDAAARDAPPAAAAVTPTVPPAAIAIPKLRPHVATAMRLPRLRPPATTSHATSHAATAPARDKWAAASPAQPYNDPPPPSYNAWPVYYSYPGYYGYYPRYGYYRAY